MLAGSIELSLFVELTCKSRNYANQKKFKYLHHPLFKRTHEKSCTKRKRKYTDNRNTKKAKSAIQEDDGILDTLLGKWRTHKYTKTTKKWASAKKLQDELFAFFDHYKNHADYKITELPEFQAELEALKEIAKKHWTLDE